MSEAYIYEAIRTPRGRGKKGSLYATKPVDLVAGLVAELRLRLPGLDPDYIDDLVLGVVTPIGDQGGDIAKAAAMVAGLPDTVAGVQVNRFCASGLEATNIAAAKVRSGWDRLVLAGGVESMSRVPMLSDGGALFDRPGHDLRPLLRAAGHRRGPDRHPGRVHPRGRRRLRRPVPAARRHRVARGQVQAVGRAGHRRQRRDSP